MWLVAIQVGSASSAGAQATVPDRGEGTLTLTYQNYDVSGHFDALGRKNNNGGTQSHALVTEIDYGVVENVGLIVSLPFITSKYTGPPSYYVGQYLTYPGPLDDGTYHGAFQDVRVEVRRLWWAGPVAVTPFVGLSFPTHDYETIGEAVPGRHRRDVQFGASAGVDTDRIVPNSYVHARYGYGTMERVNGFPFTRSNIDVEASVGVGPRVLVRGLVGCQVRHEGPSLDELAADWVHHDRFIAPSYVNLGAGLSLSLSRSTDVFAAFVGTAAGSNGAHRARLVAVGAAFALRSGLHGLGGSPASLRHQPGASLTERFQ